MSMPQWFVAAVRAGTHAGAAAALAASLAMAAHSSTATVGSALGALASAQVSGWQNPAEGGSGDFVFIDAPANTVPVSGTLSLEGRAGNSATDPNGTGGGGGGENNFAAQPQVVIAMIDTGGNPYHADFRDPTRLVHPSTYLTGFPQNAKDVPLCFVSQSGANYVYQDDCAPGWQANVAADAAAVNAVAVEDLVWYPGTRLMGKSFAHTDANSPVGFDQGGGAETAHGSWVSSAAVGNKFGTCPDCMLIVLEADTVPAIEAAYQWAAQQPWIDVITTSVSVGIIGLGINPALFPDTHDGGVAASQNGKIFIAAAGNGAANFGLVPTSTYLYGSSSPAIISVGASFDDGFASHWSDFPAEIMANGNSRQVADTASMTGETDVSGTSFSAPASAGVLAKSLLEARRACNDTMEGATSAGAGVLTLLRPSAACTVTSGPFANGVLTRDELHEAFVKNAVAPFDQLSPIPGPVGWVKNAYGYVDLGNGLNNGGSSIQPNVTATILGQRTMPVRAIEQFWYDTVVRSGQSFFWGARPVVDGDNDAFPVDDGVCMPDCAPAELQRYVDGFLGLNESSTFQDLFNILGVTPQQFTQAGIPARPVQQVAGVVAETGPITVSNDATHLTVRLALDGQLDGFVPTVNSTPVSYEVSFGANHNGPEQAYRLGYEFEGVDLIGLLDLNPGTPLNDKFELFVDTVPNAQGLSNICPIAADLSASFFDLDTNEAVWVVPLSAFNQAQAPATCTLDSSGRALRGGDTLTALTASAVLTVGLVNFGNGLGLFEPSTAPNYTLMGGAGSDTDGDGVADGNDQCPGTPADTPVDVLGCPKVVVTINGEPTENAAVVAGEWSLSVELEDFAAVDNEYEVVASFGTATATRTYAAAPVGPQPIQAALTATPTSGESPLLVTLDASATTGGGSGLRYTFIYGDGTRSDALTESTVEHTYTGAATYRAYVIVTDVDGQVDESERVSITSRITVDAEEDAQTVADLTADTMAGQAPLTVNFSAAASTIKTGATLQSYAFDFGDGQSRSGTSATARHVYTVPGSYTATLTVTDSGGGTSTDTLQIAVTENDVTVAVLDIVGPRTGRVPFAARFDGSKTVAATGTTIASWRFDAGEPGDADVQTGTGHPPSSISHTYTTAGSFQPSLTVTDSSQVQSEARATIAAQPVPATAAPRKKGGALGWALLLPLLVVACRRRIRH